MQKTIFVFLCLMFLSPISFSKERQKGKIEKVEKAILHVISGKMPKRFRIGRNLRNYAFKNPDKRIELSRAIINASERWNVDEYLLVAIAFREGSFRRNLKSNSTIGERSTFQIAPRTERFLVKKVEPECTTETYEGAALCAASLLVVYTKACGSIRGGVTKYASGRVCIPRSKHLHWLTNDRISMSLYLSKYVQD